MQLVRVIQVGLDVDGDGVPELGASRIYYCSQSFGSVYGTVFLAVEPDVRIGVLASPGEAPSSAARLSPPNRPINAALLADRHPSLLNAPGIVALDGVPVAAPYFHDNLPLRDGVRLSIDLADGTTRIIRSPLINDVPGAMAIQEVLEWREWAIQSANAVAYARHLRQFPLAHASAKAVLFQFAKGDQSLPNPSMSALLRAGGLTDRAVYYRHDLAVAENPALPHSPHAFMPFFPGFGEISFGAQEQMAVFFESDGTLIVQPDPSRFFEVPIVSPLPEDLGFIP